jgi:hypothetical protein
MIAGFRPIELASGRSVRQLLKSYSHSIVLGGLLEMS